MFFFRMGVWLLEISCSAWMDEVWSVSRRRGNSGAFRLLIMMSVEWDFKKIEMDLQVKHVISGYIEKKRASQLNKQEGCILKPFYYTT